MILKYDAYDLSTFNKEYLTDLKMVFISTANTNYIYIYICMYTNNKCTTTQ